MSTDRVGGEHDGAVDPEPDRPRLPASYGVPPEMEGVLPWAHADERLAGARNYWVGTTGAGGAPHAVPVWGVWADGRLFFGMDPRTRTARNLERNRAVVVHLESGDDVVILKGLVAVVTDRALLQHVGRVGAAKYGGGAEPSEDGGDEGTGDGGGGAAAHRVYAVAPRAAYAWRDFPKDATRWRFPRD